MPKRTDIFRIPIRGSGIIMRRVLKGRAFKARRKGSEGIAALAAEGLSPRGAPKDEPFQSKPAQADTTSTVPEQNTSRKIAS